MVSVIVAVSQNGVIGNDNGLLWHISEDLRRFRAITTGHPVVMGRRTFESLGCRPLPGRTNVVVSRNGDYRADGVIVVGSLEEAIGCFSGDEEIFIIGGASIYAQAMAVADRFYLTVVCRDYEGDTCYPEWDPEDWALVGEEYHERGEKFGYPFVFRDYVRVRQGSGVACAWFSNA